MTHRLICDSIHDTAFTTRAYALISSKNSAKDVFKQSLNVKVERPVVSAITQKKLANASVSVREKAEDAIVRLRNSQDREIGRIVQKDSEYGVPRINVFYMGSS